MINIAKRIFTGYFALIVLFTGTFYSCKSTQDTSITEIQNNGYQKLPKALAWKITGKNLQKPSYLYGTMHIIPKEDYFLPAGVPEAMKEAEQYVFEIDMNEMSDMTGMMGMLSSAFMSGGQRLGDLLDDEDMKLVKDHFDNMGIPLVMLDRIKPMFLTIFAGSDFSPTSMTDGSSVSYETEFLSQAKQNDLPVSGLETIEYQISIFDSIPYTDQAQMLVDGIKAADTDSDMLKETVNLYVKQDIDGMLDMMRGEDAGMEDYEDVLLHQRNKNWIPVMESKMGTQTIFFAVGAGHLAGELGVIHLLRKAGYTLNPLSVASPDFK